MGTKKLLAAPAYIPATSENIFAPVSTQKHVITHIQVTNDDASIRTFSLWVGATGAEAAGTALVQDFSLAVAGTAAATWHWYGALPLDGSNANHFLVGKASDATSCVIEVEGYSEVL